MKDKDYIKDAIETTEKAMEQLDFAIACGTSKHLERLGDAYTFMAEAKIIMESQV